MKSLFVKHLESRLEAIYAIMANEKVECLFIPSGFMSYYFLDDRPVPFHTNPHFAYLCPAPGEGHVLKISPGKKPKLYYYSPDDFWHEVSELKDYYWQDSFDIEVYKSYYSDLKLGTYPIAHSVGISPNPEFNKNYSLTEPSDTLLAQLHWLRLSKTPYEIDCMDKANALAGKAHRAAQRAFFAGKSEYEILLDYLAACELREDQLPYNSIIALNQHSAVLHYQITRHDKNGQTLLIDAGASYSFYCADITRCYFQTNVSKTFQELHGLLNTAQLELCTLVTPGREYREIQKVARVKITEILCDLGIFTCPYDQAFEMNLSDSFFPHGVGHALGLQVHDVAGKQKDAMGTPATPVKGDPYLRTLRSIQENDALTIEPGVYFIPMLLKNLKADGRTKSLIDWKLVDQLLPLGGIRIEDNVIALPQGPRNLTRQYLPS